MSSIEFEITIQRKFGPSWPVVVRVKQPDGLTTHTEGKLELSEDDFIKLTQKQENYLEYGTLLGKALFRDQVRETFVRTLAQSTQECPLRVLLANEADSKDELRSLHWERLCAPIDPGGEWNLLARDQRIPFSLYIPTIIDRRFPPIGRRDLRALVVVASPTKNLGNHNLAPFNVEQAVDGVRSALSEIPCDVLANIEGAIGEPTLAQLSAQLTNAKPPYTLLHFICHGMLGKDGETALFWATKDNEMQRFTGKDLVEELKYIGNKQGLPQLTFLCTCESADPRAEGALGGLAQRLVRDLGMPAVVAMTRKISVETALKLGQKFYQRLREHGEVDLALEEATAGLGHRHDITVPAIFSRLGGRPLFSDRLEDRELTDAEIEFGLEELDKLIAERAPNAKVLKESFEKQVQTLNQTKGSELPAARQQHRQAIDELNILCSQVLEISFEALAALDKKPPEYHAECPFPGLSSFREKKYHKFFFGRGQLVAELQRALSKDNFLAVLGPSGSGKSSVVLAGLIPQLQKQQPSVHMAYLTPSSEPVGELQASLKKVPNQNQPVVLVVDQFEELFTLCRDERQRRQFIEQLLQLAQSMKVVITMRADFLGECTFYEQLSQRMEQNPKFIGPMDAAQLGKAMKMQADKAYLEFEEELNNAILAKVEQEPGAMPLLQYALRSLWNRRWGRWLCYEEYEAIGGVQKAISQTADAVYESLSAVEQEQVKNIFIRLTRLDEQTIGGEQRRDTRRRVGLEELVPSGDDPTVTKRLVERLAGEGARLVVTSQDEVTGKEEVEVAHEALIRYWSRLQKWLEENRSNLQLREKITQAALAWEGHEREESYLVHRGGRLEDAEVLLKQPQFLNQKEKNYVTACVALRERQEKEKEEQRQRELEAAKKLAEEAKARQEAEKQARQEAQKREKQQKQDNKKLRRRAIFLAVALAGVAVAAVIAWNKQKEAELNLAESRGRYSLSRFNEGKELDAFVEAIQAGKTLKQHKETNPVVINALLAIYQRSECNRLEGHDDQVNSVSFSPNGKFLVSGSLDGTIKFWDVETGEILTNLKHDDEVESLSLSADGKILATGSWTGIIKLWNVETGKETHKLKGHNSWVNNVSFSRDGKILASSSWDRTIKLWNVETGKETHTLQGHDARVNSVSFSPDDKDDKILASGSWDGTIKLWNVKTGKEMLTLLDYSYPIYSVSFSRDGKILASGSYDGTIKLWDLETKKEIHTLQGHDGAVNSLSFSRDDKVLASGSSDGTIKLWDLETKKEIHTLKGHNGWVNSVSFSLDSKTLASGSSDNTIKLWNLEKVEKILPLDRYKEWLISGSFSRDGKILASGSSDGTVKLWNLETGKEIPALLEHDAVNSLSFSRDGKILASGSWDGTIKLWDLETKKEIHTLKGHNGWVMSLSFRPDNKILASGSEDKTIKLWNVETGKEDHILEGHNDWVMSLRFSPDDKTLASGSNDKTIKLWNVETGKEDHILEGHNGWVMSLRFSPDGKTLASGSNDKTIKLWDLETKKDIHTLKGHNNWVMSLSFRPDGKVLASGSDDRTVKLWDLDRKAEIATLPRHDREVGDVSFSPDDKVLASVSVDGKIKLFRDLDLDLDSLIERNCDWVRNYLQHNPNVSESDKHLCDGIGTQK